MADDLDFLFSDPPRHSPIAIPSARRGARDGVEWVSLRVAHDRSGIPISTLRKWAKKGRVRAKLERGPERDLRLVAWTDVKDRAGLLGREIPPPPAGDGEDQAVIVVDLTSGAYPPETVDEEHEASVLVPIEAWDRMLIQLGNLHEAGQQLADARERAARAETEAAFLRERVREYRQLLSETEAPPAAAAAAPAIINRMALETRFRRWRNRWFG
jgi:hypothetical protein